MTPAQPRLSPAESTLELTWWGTSGFRVSGPGGVFLIDPFLSRKPKARPVLDLKPGQVQEADQIFVSHGHFDHLLDVPGLAGRTGARVYCGSTPARTLVREGLPAAGITEVGPGSQEFDLGWYRALARPSRHVRFDLPLILRTLVRLNRRLFRLLPLARRFPAGEVLSWRFETEGKGIRHFGSAGSGPKELRELAGERTDVLLLPLQGHSRICRIALDYVRALEPRLVVPHHWDDFHPPLSQLVDIQPFLTGVRQEAPETEILVPRIGRPFMI